ncbi:hypothetical protein [Desulfococcus sp.]|uniref:hypothetical protein n=1 Tax=Desulfococcus sp. TaxID=2025834 RepID=UPI0035932053
MDSLTYTARLLLKMGSVMFVSLFGVELLMQLGLMRRLEPLGKPLARLARLPTESAVTFLASIGSLVAGNTMSAQFHQDGRISRRELVLSAVLNTVPLHFKEALTFHFPIILPLLGLKLCLIYIAAFWLAGFLKLAFVITWGRWSSGPEACLSGDKTWPECPPHSPDCMNRTFRQLIGDAFRSKQRLFLRMMLLLAVVTFLVQLMVQSGMMDHVNRMVRPLTDILNLPPAVIGPVSAYILSPTVGITYMANLLNEGLVSDFQAIVALLAGGILMVPAIRLRGTLPRYTAIFGVRHGPLICLLTLGLSLLARAIILMLVLLFYP